ncbi:O-antigen ligase family protein [Chloroflexales bacterium ZM16-3]|nr:O-antigen ligase family protein [Chloroflexales bacterium ZM16-3]
MSFNANNQIFLNPVWLALYLGMCAYAILKGRPEISVAMFLSIAGWTRNVMLGPIVQNYLLLATTYAAVLVRFYHRPKEIGEWLPRHNRAIILWMLLWWIWMAVLLQEFHPPKLANLRPQLYVFLIAPLSALLTFAKSLDRLKIFAVTYIITTIIGGYAALAALKIPLSALIFDPTLGGYPASHLRIANYHLFAYNFAIALIMIVGMLAQTRGLLWLIGLLGAAAYCAQFLLLAGSRQSIGGALFVVLLFAIWGLFHPSSSKPRLLLLLSTILGVGIPIYLLAPNLVVRSGESGLFEAFDLVGDRSHLWISGWEAFIESPMWGTGFVYPYSHNMFVSVLAEQGVVGAVFMLGYFYFLLLQSQVVFNGRGEDERAIWRMTFFGIIVFGMAHGLASGSPVSVRHLYWAGALLWWQCEMVRPSAIPALPFASRVISARTSQSQTA